jgi:hypothetical protein
MAEQHHDGGSSMPVILPDMDTVPAGAPSRLQDRQHVFRAMQPTGGPTHIGTDGGVVVANPYQQTMPVSTGVSLRLTPPPPPPPVRCG